MCKYTKLVMVIACISLLAFIAPVYSQPDVTDTSNLSTSELAEIISDPVCQRAQVNLVMAAISTLGDRRDIGGVDALVEIVAYPLAATPLPPDVERLPNPVPLVSINFFGKKSVLINAFPAARALVGIGDACISSVLDKLAITGNTAERNACLDVLIELRERSQVEALLAEKLIRTESPVERDNLRLSLRMLPNIERLEDAIRGSSQPNAGEPVTSSTIEARRKPMEATKANLPLMIMVGDRSLPSGSTSIDGITLVSIRELAKLLSIQTKFDGTQLALIGTQPNLGTLKLELGSKIGVVGGKSISLPLAPRRVGNGILVPLRFVAEYFDARVKWDPAPKVAWMH